MAEIGIETRECGASFSIVRGPEQVQRVSRITRLENRISFVDDPQEVRS